MSLYEKILKIYPQLQGQNFAKIGIILQNEGDGSGDYIAKWEHESLQKPTEDQLK